MIMPLVDNIPYIYIYIYIRYFFMKDIIQEDEINIVYYPTEILVADYFTKPLQGALFKKLRNIIMGWSYARSLYEIIS